MQGLGNFAAGFLGAFTAAKNQKKQREQDEQEQKAKVKLFEIQLAREKAALAREQEQQGAMQDVFSRLQGGSRLQSNPNITLGDPRPQMTLTEMLADAQMQGTLMQAGLAGPQDIVKANTPPEPPPGIRELMALDANPHLAALDLRRRTASASQVNVGTGEKYGKVPEGMRLVVGPEGPRLEKIPSPIGTMQTPGGKAVDSAFAPEYATWVAGGYADTQKGLEQLREAKKALDSGDNLTGPLVGAMPDKMRMFFNPKSVDTRQAVEEVVQRNLRNVLGGQFAQMEAAALISRAYNEQSTEKQNSKRVGRLITQIEQAAKAKQEAALYFQQNGTLDGFQGKLWTMADFSVDELPEGIPEGARMIGTANGKPVYEAPDGKRYLVD